jgi:hypothetical protein
LITTLRDWRLSDCPASLAATRPRAPRRDRLRPNAPLAGPLGPARDTARRTFVVDRKDYDAWLVGTVDEARAVLKQYPADKIEAWPVSTRVNTPKNNDAGLVVRV